MNSSFSIFSLEVRGEYDLSLARQRSRQIAALLGFSPLDQTRIAIAVSEIARNAIQYAGGGKVDFRVEANTPPIFSICISDRGSGIADLEAILNRNDFTQNSFGRGIYGARRLCDRFQIESAPERGTTVTLEKIFPKKNLAFATEDLKKISEFCIQSISKTPFEELQQQNQELLSALEELQERQEELVQLNCELDETNRGVFALYSELTDKANELQRAYDLKSQFLSSLSHEIRTPINCIVTLSRILIDGMDGSLNPEQEKQVSYIQQSAEALLTLVNDLLDIAKIEAGKVSIHPVECEVADLFAGLRGMFRSLFTKGGISLIFEEPQGLPALYTDEGKLLQILRNFLSNALKFTEKGEVRVAATVKSETAITFSVADTGIGISLEDRQRIFDEFTQIENSRQKQFKGTGLGLPLAKKLAHLLGGSVGMKSEPGVGSTFFVTIPIVWK